VGYRPIEADALYLFFYNETVLLLAFLIGNEHALESKMLHI